MGVDGDSIIHSSSNLFERGGRVACHPQPIHAAPSLTLLVLRVCRRLLLLYCCMYDNNTRTSRPGTTARNLLLVRWKMDTTNVNLGVQVQHLLYILQKRYCCIILLCESSIMFHTKKAWGARSVVIKKEESTNFSSKCYITAVVASQ